MRSARLRVVSPVEASELSRSSARTLVVGNAGSGKSWLVRRLSKRSEAPVFQLDDVMWMLGGPGGSPTAEQRAATEAHVGEILRRVRLETREDLASWLEADP